MKYAVFFVLFIIFTLLFNASGVSAATTKSSNTTIQVTPKYVKAKGRLQISFGNLSNVKKVTYDLYYMGNGIGQGVTGRVTPGKKKTESRNLLLGTCSGKVCTYHKNIKNMQLEIKTQYKNGKSATKTYKIKT